MKLEYYRQLDGIRALAAWMVMYLHFFLIVEPTDRFFRLLGKYSLFGLSGVPIFFVLSGFLITRILMQTKNNARYFGDFYVRRALRIFPLYYLFLILFYFLVPFLQRTPVTPFSNQVYYWVYLQNFARTFEWKTYGPGHFWSLAVEEHFYFIWSVLVYFLSKKGIKIAVAVIMVIAFLCRLFLIKRGYEPGYFTFGRMDELAIGSLLAVWESDGKLAGKAQVFIISFILVIIPTILIWVKSAGEALVVIQIIKFNLLSTACFCLVGYIVSLKQGAGVNKLLASRFFTFSGKISYGLYVFHPLVFAWIKSLFPAITFMPLLFVACFGVTYLTAFISYQFFESKFIVMKKYFDYNRAMAKAVSGPPSDAADHIV